MFCAQDFPNTSHILGLATLSGVAQVSVCLLVVRYAVWETGDGDDSRRVPIREQTEFRLFDNLELTTCIPTSCRMTSTMKRTNTRRKATLKNRPLVFDELVLR